MAQGSPLKPDYKKAIVSVKNYFARTRGDLAEFACDDVTKTANALGVGQASVRRVMAAYNRDPESLEKVSLNRGHSPRILDDSLQSVIREYVRTANREGSYLTSEMLFEYLKGESSEPHFSIRTLGRALDRWGFTFGKGKRSQHLKEKDYVIAARRRYLRQKRTNRQGGKLIRPEVYLDESYVNKNYSNDFIWYSNEDGPLVQKPTGKGERIIIINAITRNGWVPNARLTFKSSRKTGDYHGQMNHELFTKWFTQQLLPNIPKESLIVMDNASYHNVLSDDSAPTSSCKKDRIASWLKNNGVAIPESCLKAELIELLEKMGPTPSYAIDKIAEIQRHQILRTPPYHPELQPIETCWAVLKNKIARNCDFTMDNLLKQLDIAFNSVTKKTCSGIIKKVQKIEEKFWEEDVSLYE